MTPIDLLIIENRLLTEENDALAIERTMLMKLLCDFTGLSEAQIEAEIRRQLQRMKEQEVMA